VHGDVDPPAEERLLELLHEDAARPDLAERPLPVAVAGRRDRDERDLEAGLSKAIGNEAGLGEGKPTAAGADANEHGNSSRAASAGRTARCAAAPGRRRSEPARGAAARSARA